MYYGLLALAIGRGGLGCYENASHGTGPLWRRGPCVTPRALFVAVFTFDLYCHPMRVAGFSTVSGDIMIVDSVDGHN